MTHNHIYKILLFIIILVISNCTNVENQNYSNNKKYYVLHETIGTKDIAEENVPAMVKKNINLEFSNAEQIKWQSFKDYFIDFDDTIVQIYQDKEPSIFIANFLKNGHFYRVQYSTEGELIEFEKWINFEELPFLVSEAFLKLYQESYINGNIREFTKNHLITYRIKILFNNLKYILVYDSEGILLHKKQQLELTNK